MKRSSKSVTKVRRGIKNAEAGYTYINIITSQNKDKCNNIHICAGNAKTKHSCNEDETQLVQFTK